MRSHSHSQELSLQRNSSKTTRSTRKIIPSSTHHFRSSSDTLSDKFLILKNSDNHQPDAGVGTGKFSSFLHSLLKFLSFPTLIPPTCKWLSIPHHLSVTPSIGRKVTGTLFGHRRGHVSFSVQLDPRSDPVLLLELAITTSSLVKEMSSGLVRIALETDKSPGSGSDNGIRPRRLFQEPRWTMYCNGRKCGYVISRTCGESDWHVLKTVQSMSVGAGVIPVVEDGRKGSGSEGELLYMRARFERVVGSRDSEAFYMMNPDGNGGPELSIFLLRI